MKITMNRKELTVFLQKLGYIPKGVIVTRAWSISGTGDGINIEVLEGKYDDSK